MKGSKMNKVKLASDLVKLAKDLMSIEFDSEDALKKYLKEHPKADKSKHKVKKTDSGSSSKPKQKPQNEQEKRAWLGKFENIVRNEGGKGGIGLWTNAHMHMSQGLSPEDAAKKYLSWAKKKSKKASSRNLLDEIITDRSVAKLKNDVDEQTYKLAIEVYRELKDRFKMENNEQEALNRLQMSVNGRVKGEGLHRNNIFKAAHALGIKLPSAMF